MSGSIHPFNWSDIEPQYQALLDERLIRERVPEWLARWSELEKAVWEARAVLKRARSRDTGDASAERAFIDFAQGPFSQFKLMSQALKTKLLSVEGFEPAPELAQLMRRLRNEAALFREENVPIQAELAALEGEYSKIVGAMTVVLDGAELTLPQAEARWRETDRAKREESWRALHGRWLQERQRLSELFLKLLPQRRQLARNSGQPDYRAYRWRELSRLDYSPEDALALHAALEAEIVPLTMRLLEKRRARLGLAALRPWDLAVDPEGRPPLRPFTAVAELEEGAARIFQRLDGTLSELFSRMRQGFLDLESRKDKAPGGEEWFFPQTGLGYIHMNAAGTSGNVWTVLHESGHAFHEALSSTHQPLIWNMGGPTEVEEFAAMALEMLGIAYLEREQGGFYSAEEAMRACSEHLEEWLYGLPYIAVVDAFQQWVYAEAPEEVGAGDLDAKWAELWSRFMPGVDWDGLEAERVTGWQRKLHLFQAPLYYLEYAPATLGALQVWNRARQDNAAAFKAYRAALALGNTRTLPELFRVAGVGAPFDRSVVRDVADAAAAYLF